MFDQLTQGLALWFSVPAAIGTIVFALRLAMMFIGGDLVDDIELEVEMDTDIEADPGHGFQIFSLGTLSSFVMGFGWAGLIGFTSFFDGSVIPSAFMGFVGGAALVWLITWLLKLMHDLQSSGNVSMSDALDKEGDVYLTVPGNSDGRGQVRVIINESAKIYDAVTEGEELGRSARVRVTRVNPDRTLTVVRA